jgi:hypothetical protein
MLYVDDGLVVARTDEEAEGLVDLIASIFETRKLGEPRDMLGIEIDRNHQAGTITIRQSEKARMLAEALGVLGKGQATPMTPAAQGSLRAARDGDVMADKERFMSGIGSLLNMAQCVGPDIAAPVGALAAYSSAPTATHYAALHDVIQYVASTVERGITYGRSAVPVEIFCDANFAAFVDKRRSVSEWVVVCFGVQFPGRVVSSQRQQLPPWMPSTRHVVLQREKRCRCANCLGRSPCCVRCCGQERQLLFCVTIRRLYHCAWIVRRESGPSTLT